MKTCAKCGVEKSDECFYRRSKDGEVRSPCKKCISEFNKTDRAKSQRSDYREHGGKAIARNSELKRCYGITLDDYYKLLELQGGGCEICGCKESGQERQRALHVDHKDTALGVRVRGILCSRCNHAIGLFDHNPDRLLSAAEYLKNSLPELT